MTKLFGHTVRSELLLLYVIEAVACFGAVYWVLGYGIVPGLPGGHGDALGFAIALSLCAGFVSGASGLYRADAVWRAGRLLVATLVAAMLLALLTVLGMLIFAPEDLAALGFAGFGGLLLGFLTALVFTRLCFAVIARTGVLRRRLAVVRGPDGALSVEREIAAGGGRHEPFEIALVVQHGADLAKALAPARLCALGISNVITPDGTAVPQPMMRIGGGPEALSEAEFIEQRLNKVDLDRLPQGWLAASRGGHEGPVETVLRRGLDIVGGLAILVGTLPLAIAAAIAIRIDSEGPVLYRQERVGKNGKVFTLLKFRSMCVDAEAGGAPRWASKHDHRVTRVGRLLRLTRIDEIPQVFNVLRGDMALVGPRPERPAFVAELGRQIAHYDDRAVVKPGITGWAQVNYPYGASVEDARMKLAYDLYYIRRRSLFLDLLILVSTVRVILFQEGAR